MNLIYYWTFSEGRIHWNFKTVLQELFFENHFFLWFQSIAYCVNPTCWLQTNFLGLSEQKFESIVFDSIIMFKECWDWLINYALHRSNPFPQFHCSAGSKCFWLGSNCHVFALILSTIDGGRGNFLKVSYNLNKIVWKLWKKWKGLVLVMMQKSFSPLRSFSMWL